MKGMVLAICLAGWLCAGLSGLAAEADKEKPAARRAVVLLTDCGTDMDDQWALAHLAVSPEIDLRGVVTTHAFFLPKPEAEFTAKAAREVLAQMPVRTPPPVIPGSSVALTDKTTPLPNAGVDFLLQQSRTFSPQNRLTVLVIGAATDVASALLTDPTLGDRIAIVSMAFNLWPDGGDEWNVKNDPMAWQVLLESRAPITVGDQAVCKRDLAMTPQKADALLGPYGAPGRYLAGLLSGWFKSHPDLVRQGYWPVWDEVVTAHLLGLTKWETHPRPTMDGAMHFVLPSSGTDRPERTIRWITSLDTARLWADLTQKLDRARQQRKRGDEETGR
jgi:inosine-uridine nucleoside N-ribohydrolase